MPSDEYIRIKGTGLRQTEKAVHFRVESVGGTDIFPPEAHWFPLSQIKSHTAHPTSEGEDMIEVAAWIVRNKELM